ncbi:agamous-like MADS-box protein AGL62 [Tanacetum coccineum]
MNSLKGSTMKHQNTRLKKISIKKIEETTCRQVTFSKGHMRLFKKARELCVLTGAEMAIFVQSPGGNCYAFGHHSVHAVIDRYDNNGSTLVSSSKQPSVTELNLQYTDLEKELEREKMNTNFVLAVLTPLVLLAVLTLVELKRKGLVRAGDLANMENASMLFVVFEDRIKIQNNTINGLDFGDGIKFENNTINVPTSYLDFGDGIKFVSNTMNGPKNGLDFGDGIKFENIMINVLTSYLDFGWNQVCE